MADEKKARVRKSWSLHLNEEAFDFGALSSQSFAAADQAEKEGFIPDRPPTSYWKDAWRRFRRNLVAMVALAVLVVIVLFAFVGPLIVPYSYDQFNGGAENLHPSHYSLEDQLLIEEKLAEAAASTKTPDEILAEARAQAEAEGRSLSIMEEVTIKNQAKQASGGDSAVTEESIIAEYNLKARPFGYSRAELERKAAGEKVFPHVFGTDGFGRDIMVRTMIGARVSLLVGVFAALLVLVIGAVYGSVSGYAGGTVDAVMQRIVEVIQSVPEVLVILLISVVLKERFSESLATSTGEKDEEGNDVMEYADPSTLAVEAPDDSTFVVTLTYDCPYFLEVCAFPATFPVRQDVVSADPDGWTHNVDTYLSNGAYKLTQWDHNSQIIMAKNENYYGYDQLGPDTITFKLMDDANAMLTGFNSGELDFIEEMPVDEIPSLLSSGDLRIVPYIGTYYVCYNVEKAPFDDWRVRKAFTLAIDAQYIVENVTQTGQVPASGFVPSGVAGVGSDFRAEGGDYWTPATTAEQYQKNVEEAKQLLADAGYPNGEGFPTVTYLYNTSDNHKKIGEALQQQWQTALGVEVKLENQEWAAFLETRKNGEYQIARNGWIADYNDPISFLDMWITGGGNNDAQYSNAEYDAAIKEAKGSADPAVRMAAMHKAEDIIMGEDWALGPIYFYTQKYMLNTDVKGMYYTPLGYFFFDRCTK